MEEEERERLLPEILKEVLSALTVHTNHQAILEDILGQLQRLIPYSAANVMLLDKGTLRIVHWRGYESFGSEELISTLEQSLANLPVDAKVVQLRQPVVIPETQHEPDWRVMDETSWIKSFLAVPLSIQEQVLGLLRLDSEFPDNFSPRDAERIQPLANAVAICLKNAQPHDQTQQELAKRVIQAETEIIQLNQRLLALQYSSATITTSSLSLQQMLDTVAEEIVNLLKVAGCAIFEWDRETNTISAMTRYGLDRRWEAGLLAETFPVAEFRLMQRVLIERRPQQITINHPGVYSAELAYMHKAKLRTLLMVPMEFQDHVIGLVKLMDVARWERTFTNKEIGLAQLLVNQVASAIENVRLYEQLQQQLAEQAQIEKDLRRIAARQQAILNAIPDSMFYFGRDGKLLGYNVDSKHLPLGILDQTVFKADSRDIPPTNLVDLIRQYIEQKLEPDKMQSFEFLLVLPEGPQDFEARLVTSDSNEVLAIVRNISKYKWMKESLNQK